MHQVCKGEKGSALITVLIVMGVLTVLGAALMHYSMTDNLQVFNDEKRMQAHYLARSGAEAVADYIMKNPDGADELLGKKTEPVELGEGTFQVEVSERDNGELLIESTGEVDDFIRTVKLTMVPYGLGDFDLFCNSKIDMKKETNIKGNIGTNATDDGSIGCNGNLSIEGNVLVGPRENPNTVITAKNLNISGEIGTLDSEIKYEVPDFPKEEFEKFTGNEPNIIVEKGNYEIKDTEDRLYNSIRIDKGAKLTIYVAENTTRKIHVNTLYVNGDIVIEGDGCLNLYVNSLGSTDKIEGSFNEGGRVNALMMYYKGDTIDIEKNGKFCGTIFCDSNLVEFNVGKDSDIKGNIIIKGEAVCKIKKDGDFEGVIYAPHSEIAFHNAITVKGIVIADTVNADKIFTLVHSKEIYFPYDDNIICPGFRKGIWSD